MFAAGFSALLTLACASGDPKSFPFDDPHRVGSAEANETPTRQFSTSDGRRVFIHDNVISPRSARVLHEVAQMISKWSFHHVDGRRTEEGEPVQSGNSPWSAPLDAYLFGRSSIGRLLQTLLSATHKKTLYAYDARSYLYRRGDDTMVNSGAPREDDEVWSVLYTASVKWKGDFYGELLFYDDEGEIVGVAQPRPRRLVSWDGFIPHLSRPPSLSHTQGQGLMLIRWTTNASKVAAQENERTAYDAETANGLAEGLFTRGDRDLPSGGIDVSAYETQRTRTEHGKQVIVFDNLLNKSDVDALRRYAKRYAFFYFSDYSVGDEGSDNVQWIGSFEVRKLWEKEKYFGFSCSP